MNLKILMSASALALVLAASAAAASAAHSAQPLPRYDTRVLPEWVDYNDHMTDFRYGQVFGEAMDAFYRQLGIDDAYRKAGHMYYDVESHVRHLAEAKVGEALYVTTQVLGVDDKRLHVFHRLRRCCDDAEIATGEYMHLNVDRDAAKAAKVDAAIRARIESIRQVHAVLPVPLEAGRRVGSRALS